MLGCSLFLEAQNVLLKAPFRRLTCCVHYYFLGGASDGGCVALLYSFQGKNLVFWKALMWQFSLFLRYSGSGVFCTAKLSTRYSNFGRSKNKAWLIPDYYRLLPCNFFGNKTLHKRSRILVEDRAAWSLPCLGEQRQQKALLLLLLLLTVAVEEVS